MADIGMDAAGLAIKKMEVEISIAEKEVQKQRISLEITRMEARTIELIKSTADIEKQIEAQKLDVAAITETRNRVLAGEQ